MAMKVREAGNFPSTVMLVIKKIKGGLMSSNQTYDNCQCFEIKNVCPHRNNELMKGFIGQITPLEGVHTTLDVSKAKRINEKLCNKCEFFRPVNR